MIRNKDPKIQEAAQPVESEKASVNIAFGSSFYDWLAGPHKGIVKALIVIAAIIILIALSFVSWVIPVFFIAAVVLGYIVFRNAFFAEDSVRLVALFEEDPSRCDLLLIGKEKFKKMNKSGLTSPLVNGEGDPVFYADDYSSEGVKFSWIHETSRFNFLMKATAFQDCKELAEDSSKKLYKIQNVPDVLALKYSGSFIRRYESFYQKVLSGEDMDDIDKELREEISETKEVGE